MLSNEPEAPETYKLVLAVRAVFHRLALTADTANRDLGVNASQRGVLETLSQGARSVPSIARAKEVSRQHIQVIANGLIELGLVEAVENPAHRRSPLLSITAAGRRRFEKVRAREGRVLTALSRRLHARSLAHATKTLWELHGALRSLDVTAAHRRRAGSRTNKERQAS
jgi:DNA-binding MarR family transcriptional regulator